MVIKTGEPLLASDINDLTFFPKGVILTFSSEAYSATSAEFKNIWKICDGQNGTPNLVGKFLRGGSTSGALGGADSVTLNASHMPAHSHSFSGTTVSAGSHSHSIGSMGNQHLANAGVGVGKEFLGTNTYSDYSTGSGGAHTHTFSGTTSSYGNGGGSVPTVPSYYQVIYIMKVS
jgi:microcystin-dependent protein